MMILRGVFGRTVVALIARSHLLRKRALWVHAEIWDGWRAVRRSPNDAWVFLMTRDSLFLCVFFEFYRAPGQLHHNM